MTPAILLIIGTFGLAFYASWRVKSAYQKFSQYPSTTGMTGAEAASRILRAAGIHDVEIVPIEGTLTDHYDPMNKRLALSAENYHGHSVAAIGVAAHEAGHALQHAQAYAPLQWRMAAVNVTNIANQVVLWLPLIGMLTGFIRGTTGLLIMAIAWGVIMLFNLVTLPVEFDATARAKKQVASLGLVGGQAEANGMARVLDAAALTYVSAFITSFAYMLWHLLPLLTQRDEE